MKKTILIAITILAYFFAVSCEDAVNSDDNIYKEYKGYEIYYSVANEINEVFSVYKSSVDGTEQSLWRDSSLFVFGAQDNRLLLYESFTNDQAENKQFFYSLYDFNKKEETFPFGEQPYDKFLRLLPDNRAIACTDIAEDQNPAYILDLETKVLTKIGNGTSLLGVYPSTDGNKFSVFENNERIFKLVNSIGTITHEFDATGFFVPSSWSYDDEDVIGFSNWIYNNEDEPEMVSRILKYNTTSESLDTLTEQNQMLLYYPKMSPDGKKIAFVNSPNGLCTINADGSNYQVLRDRSGTENVDFLYCDIKWSPDSRYILYKPYNSSNTGDVVFTGLAVYDTQTNTYTQIVEEDIVFSATWIEKK
jgi:Tol biopolymer transport system component